jgi:hypothetical protein
MERIEAGSRHELYPDGLVPGDDNADIAIVDTRIPPQLGFEIVPDPRVAARIGIEKHLLVRGRLLDLLTITVARDDPAVAGNWLFDVHGDSPMAIEYARESLCEIRECRNAAALTPRRIATRAPLDLRARSVAETWCFSRAARPLSSQAFDCVSGPVP